MVENQKLYSKQEIKDILIKKESLLKVQPKRRMVVQKPRNIKTESEKLACALKRACKQVVEVTYLVDRHWAVQLKIN